MIRVPRKTLEQIKRLAKTRGGFVGATVAIIVDDASRVNPKRVAVEL